MIRTFEHAIVTNVVDGDTVDVVIDAGFSVSVKQRLRLARIDTPEKGQPGWQAATDYLKNVAGLRSATVITSKSDKYGRYVAELIIDGRNINDELLNVNLAKPYP